MFLSHFEINLSCVNFNYLCECGNYIKTLSIFYDAWGSSWGCTTEVHNTVEPVLNSHPQGIAE